MSLVRRYIAERSEDGGSKQSYESDGNIALWISGNNTASLRQKGDDFIYAWDNGIGKGRVRIPGHIIFDLPDLLTVMNHATRENKSSGIGLFGETRFYEQQDPIAVLFPRDLKV